MKSLSIPHSSLAGGLLLIPARITRIGKEGSREFELVRLAVDAPENLVAVIKPQEEVRHLLRRVIRPEPRVVVVLRRVVGDLALAPGALRVVEAAAGEPREPDGPAQTDIPATPETLPATGLAPAAAPR